MNATPALRAILAIIGVIAGFAYYLLLDEGVLDGAPAQVQRAAIYFAVALFPAFGLMAGPLAVVRAGIAASVLATLTAGLAVWTGARFPAPPDVGTINLLEPTGDGLILGPFLGLVALMIPVLIAAQQTAGGWRDHRRVIPLIWIAAVKALIALLFLLVFWALYFLSNALLQLVGVEILEDFVDFDPGFYLLSGAVTGVSLAVTCELEEVVKTLLDLVLRLLRLLLVPLAGVMTLFVLAVVVQGVDQVFDQRSAAGTMMAMAAGAVGLIAAALNGHTAPGQTHPALRWSIRILGLVLPVVGAIALYAVWLRVGQYGWTPSRVMAALCGIVVLAFVAPVSLFGLPAQAGWQSRVMSGFLAAMICTLALAAVWFTPLLNAQGIAAASQLERFRQALPDADYDVWPLAHEWGTPGRKALAALKAMDLPDVLRARIEAAETAQNRYAAQAGDAAILRKEAWAELRDKLPVRPEDAALPDYEDIAEVANYVFDPISFRNWCAFKEGPPNCVAVRADFLTDAPAEEWMLLRQDPSGNRSNAILLFRDANREWRADTIPTNRFDRTEHDLIGPILRGEYTISPARVQALEVGPLRLMPSTEAGD